ncbi:DNA cytosine methyltransferase [Limnovirga soli]|uniref:Cytosine-specific methyltransferase n=1 Tax=Limnovirga soli TaxID=2656915 RepID=A0A8J8FGE2_9BACT|nr:DNA (cytosine-5-)-methyltransferase [Limnovirga soli]NNV57656.1 DNA (cytosine-5-)-methyltransferase [Limnovirga soli]
MREEEINQLSFFDTKVNKNSYKEICSKISDEESLSPDDFGKAIKKWATKNLDKSINIVALFSGAGGLDIGFSDTGFSLVESVELEEKFVQTMMHNQMIGKYFADANITCKDIRQYEPNIATPIDFIIGGPPCQSFSAAGRRAAGVAGTKDNRGNLFEEYVRVLEKLKPKGFLFENVYGLLGAEKGESIKKIVAAFKEIGYNISYRILDAADYGVPQHRERIILVGSKGNLFKFPKPTHGPDSHDEFPHYSAHQAILNVDKPDNDKLPLINGRFGHLLEEVPTGLNYSFFTEKMGHPNPIFAWRSKFSDFLYKADPIKPIRTLKASGGQYTGPFHWENRHFTIEELKRLQTFPDDYKILGNRAIASKQIGNSVPPQFARMLALSVLNQFFNVNLPFEFNYLEEVEKLSFRKLKSEKTDHYFQKAAAAIDSRKENPKKEIVNKIYKVELTNNFKIKSNPKSEVEVRFKAANKKWNFELNRNENAKELYRIELRKIKNSPLFLSVNEVQLISNSSILTDYTVLWKVFEQALAENHIKADLIQLFGYYQYSNDIVFSFTKAENEITGNVWKVLELILADNSIGQIKNINQFATSYDISKSNLLTCFYELRKIGFEIRNSNTNPEISENEYLIPYRFPSLNHFSVQLKKSLQAHG